GLEPQANAAVERTKGDKPAAAATRPTVVTGSLMPSAEPNTTPNPAAPGVYLGNALQTQQQPPVLGDLPAAGKLFRSKSETRAAEAEVAAKRAPTVSPQQATSGLKLMGPDQSGIVTTTNALAAGEDQFSMFVEDALTVPGVNAFGGGARRGAGGTIANNGTRAATNEAAATTENHLLRPPPNPTPTG